MTDEEEVLPSPPPTTSLTCIGFDCAWEICFYLANDYRSLTALARTCRTFYTICAEEYVWREVARACMPTDVFDPAERTHARMLDKARMDAQRWYRAQQRAGLVDPDEDLNVGRGDVTDMSLLLPDYFRDLVRVYALRSVTRNIQLFIEAAMNSSGGTVDATVTLTEVKRREGDLRAYFAQARDISFPQHCIGRSGAMLLASSLNLCSGATSNLSKIDLTNQLIRDDGAVSLLAALAGSRRMLLSIRSLSLSNNKLSDEVGQWVGNFVHQTLSRGGSLVELDLSDNPSLCEETLIQLSSGIDRALFGGTISSSSSSNADLLQTSCGLRKLLLECQTDREGMPAAWARVPLRSIVLSRTHIGRCNGGQGRGKRITDASSAPYNSAGGALALCQLVGCLALLGAAETARSISEATQDDVMRERQTLHINTRREQAMPSSTPARKNARIRLSMQDCGLDRRVISRCVEYLVEASADVRVETDRRKVNTSAVCQLSIDVSASPTRMQGDRRAATPNSEKTFGCVAEYLQRAPPGTKENVQLVTTSCHDNNTSDAPPGQVEGETQPPKLVLGPCLAWEVTLPRPPVVEGSRKQGGCLMM